MPNYVENDLYITGAKEDVNALIQSIAGTEGRHLIDFNKIIPYPEAFRIKDAEYERLGREKFHETYGRKAHDGYNSGGHDWCCDNWGTKWNAASQCRRDYEDRVCITFQTAWDPPIPVIEALHKMHPECTLSLEYFERGMGFCGGVRFLCKEDSCEEDGWEAGTRSHAWKSIEYQGTRGG